MPDPSTPDLWAKMQSRFLIIEDHPLYAEVLLTTIGRALPNVDLVWASTLAQAKAIIGQNISLDLVLLDLWLPDCHGFEGLIELRMLRPSLPVVVTSAFSDAEVVHNAVACGASGFIAKSATRDELVQDIQDVLNGYVPLPHKYSPTKATESEDTEELKIKLGTLTPQQLRVLQMLCQGLLNKQIAHVLGVGETTVKAHVSEILRKLGVNTRTQAVLGVSKVSVSPELRLNVKEVTARFQPLAVGQGIGRRGRVS